MFHFNQNNQDNVLLKQSLSAIYFIVASKTLLLILPPSHLEPYKNGGTRSLSARLWVWGRYCNGAIEFSRRVVQLAVQEKEFRSFNISITAAYSSYQEFPKLWCNVHSFRWGNNIQWFNHLITWGLYLAKTVFLSFMKETSDLHNNCNRLLLKANYRNNTVASINGCLLNVSGGACRCQIFLLRASPKFACELSTWSHG